MTASRSPGWSMRTGSSSSSILDLDGPDGAGATDHAADRRAASGADSRRRRQRIVSGLSVPPGFARDRLHAQHGRDRRPTPIRSTRSAEAPTATDRWTTSETGGLDPSAFAEPSRIEYPTFDGRKIPAFVYRPSPRKFPGPRPVLIDIHGGPEGQFRPGFLGRLNYLVDELGLVADLPQRPGLVGLRQDLSEARQRQAPRRRRQGHRRPARLDRHAAGPRQVPRRRDRRLVRRVHVAGRADELQRPDQGGHRHRRHLELRHVPEEHAGLSPRPPPRRVRRRARPRDAVVPRADLAARPAPTRSARRSWSSRARTTRGCRSPRPSRWSPRSGRTSVPVWYVVGTNEGHGFAKKANQDYLQAVEVEFLRRYLLGRRR